MKMLLLALALFAGQDVNAAGRIGGAGAAAGTVVGGADANLDDLVVSTIRSTGTAPNSTTTGQVNKGSSTVQGDLRVDGSARILSSLTVEGLSVFKASASVLNNDALLQGTGNTALSVSQPTANTFTAGVKLFSGSTLRWNIGTNQSTGDEGLDFLDNTRGVYALSMRSGTGDIGINPTSGRVGIGTPAPGATLHVASTGTGVGLQVVGAVATPFRVGDSTFVVKGDSGDIGIGTASPGLRLDVESNANGERGIRVINGTDGTAASSVLKLTAGGVLANVVKFAPAHATYPNALLLSNVGTTSPLVLATQDTERLRIDSAGNIGISTNAPQIALDVQGPAAFGIGLNRSTFSATGSLAMPNGAAISGAVTFPSTVTVLNAAAASVSLLKLEGGGGESSGGPPTLLVNPTANGTYVWGINTLAPNLANGNNVVNFVGYSTTTKDAAYIGFNKVGVGNSNNYGKLGLYGVDDILTFNANTNVGIGTGTGVPAAKLDVAGNAQFGSGVSKSSFNASGYWLPPQPASASGLCTTAGVTGAVIMDSTNFDLWTGTGTANGAWRNSRTGAGPC